MREKTKFLPRDIGRRFRGAELQEHDAAGVRTSRAARIPRIRFDAYGQSERGTLRQVNEDQFFTMPVGPGTNYLLGVADGIGGAPGGERASAMAAETFQRFIRDERELLLRPERNAGEIIQTLTRGLNRCQGELQQFVDAHPIEYTGMGTTMTAALVLWPHLYLVHMGNARACLVRQGKMKTLTHEHTYGQALLDAGVLNESTFKTSAMRNILSTFLGDHVQTDPEVRPDIHVELLHPGDTLLFTTNGLTHAVPEETLLKILKDKPSSQDLCQKLMDSAREHQSKDDATALVARFVDVPETPRRPEARE